MRRKLIAIGCNDYQNMQRLNCAEDDSNSIFSLLTLPTVGDYETAHSSLLLSPTRSQIEECLNGLFSDPGEIDTFTFFFAGHGGVKAGSYYLCPVDAREEALSATAISLSMILLRINEVSPRQTNIIIDACQGGGLGEDLGTLLRSPILGESSAPGVNLLATCARDEIAYERDGQGVGTKAILDCIEGRIFIQDLTAALDLSEISKAVSQVFEALGEQTPIAFGLNLFGSSRFCRNPHFASDRGEPLRVILPLWPVSSEVSLETRYRKIRDLYISVENEWNPRSFANLIDPIFVEFRENPAALVAFAERLNAALMVRAAGSSDAYRAPLVAATIATSLLPFSGEDIVRNCLVSIQRAMANALDDVHNRLIQDLKDDPFCLLQSALSGMVELFTLPKRISQILGWCAVAASIGGFEQKRVDILLELYRLVLDSYEGSFRLMSDEQGACVAISLFVLRQLCQVDMAEELIGLLLISLLDVKGCIASRRLDEDLILKYLFMRASNHYELGWNEIANPSETLAVILKAAIDFRLIDVFDKEMWHLDKRCMLIFEAENVEDFGRQTIELGCNTSLQIGRDVFMLQDLADKWPIKNRKKLAPELANAMMTASVLYPDRVAWSALV